MATAVTMDLVPLRGEDGAAELAMDSFADMDLETAALILQLQIDDSEELFASSDRKGKGREGVLSDTQLALQIFKEEMQRNAAITADRQMTRSIHEACRTDGNEIATSLAQERAAARDRQISLVVSGVTEPLAVTEGVVDEDELDDVLERLDAWYVDATKDKPASMAESMALVPYGVKGNPVSESSTRAAVRALTAPKRPCTACQETLLSFELARVPCRHEYCGRCLRDLFSASMTDDTLFPPRCCREPITPVGHVRTYLSAHIVQRYEAKKIEFDTPNRTYCSNPLCSSFIRAEHIVGDHASGQLCRTVTCPICKVTAHRGDCPEDTALQLVLEVAQDNQWQRCWSCRRLVELDTGCNHITFVLTPPNPSEASPGLKVRSRCPCSAEFCYACGERWKTCQCDQWDENRLYARAGGRGGPGACRETQLHPRFLEIRRRSASVRGVSIPAALVHLSV
ncbi:hypothetical protein BUE80_DR010964 [Diplocarpon rosae]|nr:hypothetical protein BUE80_DR010964 [Diplocarpon rosae]